MLATVLPLSQLYIVTRLNVGNYYCDRIRETLNADLLYSGWQKSSSISQTRGVARHLQPHVILYFETPAAPSFHSLFLYKVLFLASMFRLVFYFWNECFVVKWKSYKWQSVNFRRRAAPQDSALTSHSHSFLSWPESPAFWVDEKERGKNNQLRKSDTIPDFHKLEQFDKTFSSSVNSPMLITSDFQWLPKVFFFFLSVDEEEGKRLH